MCSNKSYVPRKKISPVPNSGTDFPISKTCNNNDDDDDDEDDDVNTGNR